MNEVKTPDELQAVATIGTENNQQLQPGNISNGQAMLNVIERALANPDVDVDKLERLLAIQTDIFDREAKQKYVEAMALMHPELPVISKTAHVMNKHGKRQSSYAKFEDINQKIKPILFQHGFNLSFKTAPADRGMVTVVAVLTHRAGHSEESALTLPMDTSGSKNPTQGVGSTMSYGERYTTTAILNLTVKGGDDDGQTAGPAPSSMNETFQAAIDVSKREASLGTASYKAWFDDQDATTRKALVAQGYHSTNKTTAINADRAANQAPATNGDGFPGDM